MYMMTQKNDRHIQYLMWSKTCYHEFCYSWIFTALSQ